MNWLAKLFKGTFSAASSPNPNISEPEKELPIDEAFVKNFKDKGGIFVYVEKKEDLPKVFQTVLSLRITNNWRSNSRRSFLIVL